MLMRKNPYSFNAELKIPYQNFLLIFLNYMNTFLIFLKLNISNYSVCARRGVNVIRFIKKRLLLSIEFIKHHATVVWRQTSFDV